ncbi:hypothetical protein I317_06068 [Kwoniella heveanensis CBS 569]|nr:hypothetical protein I317_06068 [Kwoniella heveanensis CBS 569]
MPKAAAEDHRPARAVLHAPYPLPFIVTRQPPVPPLHSQQRPFPAAPASVPPRETAHSPVSVPQVSASIADFPAFSNDWRTISPAFPPFPYPKDDGDATEERRERVKRLRLLKWKKGKQDESSEYEMMSLLGLGDEGSSLGTNLLGLTRQVGKISPGGGGQDEEWTNGQESNMDENNLLIYAFVSSFERGAFDSPPSDSSPKTPTGPAAIHSEPSIHDCRYHDEEAEYRSNRDFQPLKPKTPAWDIVSDAMSSLWSDGTDADQADEEGNTKVSPASQSLITPSVSASQLAQRIKKASHSPGKSVANAHPSPQHKHKPLFLGQTNQAPFTYVPRPRAPPSQSSLGDGGGVLGGYVSEAGSVRTVRQIVRSRVNRMKVKRERERERAQHQERNRSITPMQRDYQRQSLPKETHQQTVEAIQPPRLATAPGLSHTSQPTMVAPHTAASIPQQSMFGLDAFAFAPFAPLLRPSEVLSSPPTSGSGSHPAQQISQPALLQPPPAREPSYSPQPMSIDPRTTETQLWGSTSWPHPLPAREQIAPPNASNLLRRIDEGVDVPMPTAESRLSQPRLHRPEIGRSVNRGSFHARAKGNGVRTRAGVGDGDDDVVPLGKACHNAFLLRQRAGARKREGALAGLKARLGKNRHPTLKGSAEQSRLDQHSGGYGATAGPSATGQHIAVHPALQQQPQLDNLNQAQAPWLVQLQSMIQQLSKIQEPQAPQLALSSMGPPINWFPQTQVHVQPQSPALGQMPNWAQAMPLLQALGLAFPGMASQSQQQVQQQQHQQLPMQQASIMSGNAQPASNQNIQFPPTPAPAQGLPHEYHRPTRISAHVGNQRQASRPTWATQPFSFPTPGPTPHVPGPAFEEQAGHGDMKPPRKRRRSISPTSAHDPFRRTRSPSAARRTQAAGTGLPFPFTQRSHTHLQPATDLSLDRAGRGRGGGLGGVGVNLNGLLGSPAQIINKRSPTYRAQTPKVSARQALEEAEWMEGEGESEDGSMYDQAKLDIGIGAGGGLGHSRRAIQPQTQTPKVPLQRRTEYWDAGGGGDGDDDGDVEGGETEVERVGRRDKWVHAQRRINAKGKGRAL